MNLLRIPIITCLNLSSKGSILISSFLLIFAAYETICHIPCFLVILASLIFYGGSGGLISYLIVVAFARKREWRLYWKLSAVRFMDMIIVVISLRISTVECCGMNGCGIERLILIGIL